MEDKEKSKESKYSLFKGFNCSECRTYEHPVSKIYQTMIDCTKFHEWWPKSFTSKVEECKPEIIGSIINFTSDWGNYTAEISEIKENEQMSIDYNKGILQGLQVWRVKELEPTTDSSGNIIPKTEVCYDAEIYPTTKKLQLFTSFLSESSKRSYFSPLLDSLEGRMAHQAAEEKRRQEELILHQQIQEQELTIVQEEDQQIEELKNIQLQLNQVQSQVQQYMARLEAQKAKRESQRQKFLQNQKPVPVGTSTPPAPPVEHESPPPSIPEIPPPSLPTTPEVPSTNSSSSSSTPTSTPVTASSVAASFGPALASVLNSSPIVMAVANSAKSSGDEPFSQVNLHQEPRSVQKLKQIDISSIDEPLFVVPISKPDSI